MGDFNHAAFGNLLHMIEWQALCMDRQEDVSFLKYLPLSSHLFISTLAIVRKGSSMGPHIGLHIALNNI